VLAVGVRDQSRTSIEKRRAVNGADAEGGDGAAILYRLWCK